MVILDDVIENDLPELKKKIDDKAAMFKLLYELRGLRKKTVEKLEELENEISRVKTQQTREKIVNDLQTKELIKLKKVRQHCKHIRQQTKTMDHLLGKEG